MEEEARERADLKHCPDQRGRQLRRVFGQGLGDHHGIGCAAPALEHLSGAVDQANVDLLVGNAQTGIDFTHGSSSFSKPPDGHQTRAGFVVVGRMTLTQLRRVTVI